MPSRIALIDYITDEKYSADFAKDIVARAKELGVDLLIHLAQRTGLTETYIYQQAARFCGLAFYPDIPRGLDAALPVSRINSLATTRSLRLRVLDREVVFMAPGANAMLALKAAGADRTAAFAQICIVPPGAVTAALTRSNTSPLMANARQRLARRWPYASAHLDLTLGIRIVFAVLLLALVTIAAIAPFWLEPVLVPFLMLMFLPPAWFRLAALFEQSSDDDDCEQDLGDTELPVYTVLIPLRDEAQMVPQLAAAMRALDYPAEKLDIKFIVESVSASTIRAVQEELPDPRFSLVVVPDAMPQTKPKALNYALPLVRGDHLVIFDAEDIPEPAQLRRAASLFHRRTDLDCIQAELAIDNGAEGWLPGLFSAEYSGLFGVMLPALARWRLPMPLGGTSNHFRVSALREVGGWDAFNVTEDADLGIRLTRLRYRTGVLAAHTYEEAPVNLGSWLRQRTRWMKGWMQTFIVHNRKLGAFAKDMGLRNLAAFEIFIGGMIFSAPLHLVFLIALIVRFALGGRFGAEPLDMWGLAHLFVLVAGYAGAASHAVTGIMRLKQPELYRWLWLLPIYWGLIGVAAFLALYELLVRPYFWAKTGHGKTRLRRSTAPQEQTRTAKPGTTATPSRNRA